MAKFTQLYFYNSEGNEALAHLLQSAFSMHHFIQHKQWDEGEGDSGDEPAQDVCPEWINISVIELKRGVFDDGEDEGAL